MVGPRREREVSLFERFESEKFLLRHEYELSLRRRALEQLVGAPRLGERQPLGHDRMDLALAEQLE
jgi:hypothetical protein